MKMSNNRHDCNMPCDHDLADGSFTVDHTSSSKLIINVMADRVTQPVV